MAAGECPGRRHRIGRAAHSRRDALGRRRRPPASDAAIEHGAERVDVGPRPLIAPGLVLFERRVALGDDGRDAFDLAAEGLARGAEIEQHRAPVLADVDVGRLDVAMQEMRRVDVFEPVEDGADHLVDLGFGQRVGLGEQRVERLPLDILHDEIGGAVVLEIAVDGDDVGMLERDQRLRLLAEAIEAPVESFLGRGADRADLRAIGRARGEARGQILLDRDLAPDLDFLGQIGDAEAARAEHAQDAIAVEFVPDRQGVDVVVGQAWFRAAQCVCRSEDRAPRPCPQRASLRPMPIMRDAPAPRSPLLDPPRRAPYGPRALGGPAPPRPGSPAPRPEPQPNASGLIA